MNRAGVEIIGEVARLRCAGPFLHLDTHLHRILPYSTDRHGLMHLNQAAYGDRERGFTDRAAAALQLRSIGIIHGRFSLDHGDAASYDELFIDLPLVHDVSASALLHGQEFAAWIAWRAGLLFPSPSIAAHSSTNVFTQESRT